MLKYCFSWTSVLFWTLSSFAHTPKDSLNSEVAAPYYERKMDYSGIKEQTYYVMMDDSVRLAVNVYLPKGLKKGEKIPAVLVSDTILARCRVQMALQVVYENGAKHCKFSAFEISLNTDTP
jgi:hypothetical protein